MVSIDAGLRNQTRENLAGLIAAGNTLFDERFDSSKGFAGWLTRYETWQANVLDWMAQNESFCVSFRFRRISHEGPQIRYRQTSGPAHDSHLNRLRARLMYLGSI